LLAGCSSGSQLAPAGNLGAQSIAHGPAANVPRKWVTFASSDEKGKLPPPNSLFNYIFTNDSTLSNVDVYQAMGGVLQAQCAGCGGWGLASHKTMVAYGVNGGTIQVIGVSKVGGLPSITFISILTLTSGNALGLAFDTQGNLYASDYPSSCWDKFSASTVISGGGPSSHTCNTLFSPVSYLATKGLQLYLDGIDAGSGNFATGTATALIQDVPNVCGTGFTPAPAGGIAIQPAAPHTMAVTDQYGCITEWNPPTYLVPSTNTPPAFGWSYPTDEYTDVVFGKNQNNLWASGYAPAGLCGGGSPPCGFASAWKISPLEFLLGTTAPGRPGEEPISITQVHN